MALPNFLLDAGIFFMRMVDLLFRFVPRNSPRALGPSPARLAVYSG